MLARLLAAFALLLAPAAAAQAQPAQRDWTRTVVATPEGGFRMGNPDAPVKVVEFLSLTCPTCAHFAEHGAPQLIGGEVRSGRVSLEYRNFVLNAYDLAAAMISRCAAPQDYFALNHAIFAAQPEWMARIQAVPAAERQQLASVPPTQGMQRIVGWAGLEAIAARHGVSAEEARACLSDQARLDRIVAMRRAGDGAGVGGTPTFAINGRIAAGVHDWGSLEPLIRAAR